MCDFTAVADVLQTLCDGQGGSFPAFYSASGSDLKISQGILSGISQGTNLDVAIANVSCSKEPEHITISIHHDDILLYIYTSGTTGNLQYFIVYTNKNNNKEPTVKCYDNKTYLT